MAFFGLIKSKKPVKPAVLTLSSIKGNAPTSPGGDVTERPGMESSIKKAYIPNFLYKPPFGYPRSENIPLLKQFAKNPYIHSVINMLSEEAASNKWEIVPKNKDSKMTASLESSKKNICNFLENPNGNKEGFSHILKVVVRDLCELDSGVWVKAFNRFGEMKEIFARDGGTFLKNPDIFGYMGNRQEIIFPDEDYSIETPMDEHQVRKYELKYSEAAAYYQYGWTVASMPVPYGRREVVYFMKNPKSDSIYGISPVSILADVILTLVYGSRYNLDFYMNSNMPEGIISLIGAKQNEIEATKRRFENVYRKKDEVTGFWRRQGFKFPWTNTDAKFTPFQLSSKEMEIISQQQWFSKLVWMCFGLTADDLGFTENSNKAVSESMERRYSRKAVKPLLNLIAERINQEIIPEFGTEELMFKFEDYDLDEDIKKHQLYESQIRMGIKTAEMVAEEENIDITKLIKQKDEQREKDMEMNNANNDFFGNEEKDENPKKVKKKAKKDEFEGTVLEKEMVKELRERTSMIREVLKKQNAGSLQHIS